MKNQPEHEPGFKCATFDAAMRAAIPPEIRARMDADRAAAEAAEPRRHQLKCWPEFFGDIRSGAKTFEVRKHDRDFNVGDLLYLEEWAPATLYTGQVERVLVSYVLPGGRFGIEAGHCVLGIKLLRPFRAEAAQTNFPKS